MNSQKPSSPRTRPPEAPAKAAPPPRVEDHPEPGAGLRARLWLGSMLGALVGATAVLWIASALAPSDALFDPGLLGIWPWTAATVCIVVGVAIAIWLDYGIVIHLRGVARALETGDPSDLRGLPSASGWGELSAITEQAQNLIAHQRSIDQGAHELDELRQNLRALRATLESHPVGDTSLVLPPAGGSLGPVIESLNRRLAANDASRRASRSAALELREEILHAVEEAREASTHAERGFVEASALVSTAHDLERLATELESELAREPSAETTSDLRSAAGEAIEELIDASSDGIEHLAAGLFKMQEIHEQVQQIGNRATLIALQTALTQGAVGEAADEVRADDLAPELQALAREVQAATELTEALSREMSRDVALASERMEGVRERVGARLESIAPAPTKEGGLRLLERMRERVRDTERRAETLTGAGEQASSAADRVLHRLEEDALAIEMLATSVGATPADLAEPSPEAEARSRTPNLRLLGRDDEISDESNSESETKEES